MNRMIKLNKLITMLHNIITILYNLLINFTGIQVSIRQND